MPDVVVDASTLVNYLLDLLDPRLCGIIDDARSHLHAPGCIEAETLHTLNKHRRYGGTDTDGFLSLSRDLAAAPIERHETPRLTAEAAALCGALSAYDAFYVALAQQLDAPLMTSDRRLVRAIRASIPGVKVIT